MRDLRHIPPEQPVPSPVAVVVLAVAAVAVGAMAGGYTAAAVRLRNEGSGAAELPRSRAYEWPA